MIKSTLSITFTVCRLQAQIAIRRIPDKVSLYAKIQESIIIKSTLTLKLNLPNIRTSRGIFYALLLSLMNCPTYEFGIIRQNLEAKVYENVPVTR